MRNALTRFQEVDKWLDNWVAQYTGDAVPTTFPHFDIVKVSENEYRIDLAVAGFSRDTLDVSIEQGTLTVKGSKSSETDGGDYIHRGIAKRAFTKQFVLGEQLRVVNANLDNGVLSIELEREIPEALRPQQIPIL